MRILDINKGKLLQVINCIVETYGGYNWRYKCKNKRDTIYDKYSIPFFYLTKITYYEYDMQKSIMRRGMIMIFVHIWFLYTTKM